MWYVVYTKPRCEKKVYQLFLEKEYESYCPMQIVEKQWSDRIKNIEVPLFSSYVFIRAKKDELKNIRYINGVVNFVYWLGSPAEIRDSEIATLKDFLETNETSLIQIAALKIDDKIKIKNGAFKDKVGVVTKILKNKTILFVESLGIQIIVPSKK